MSAMYWQQMTREELTRELSGAVVILPTGATEQHGPHLATGVDSLLITEIAARAADVASKSAPVIVLPTVPFGSSTHHIPLGGTLTLHSETYYSMIRQLIISVLDAGGSKVFVLNGHGGNHEINQLVARDVVLEFQGMGLTVTIAAASWWNLVDVQQLPGMNNVRVPGHAGRLETSLMKSAFPDHVREPIAERKEEADPAVRIEGVRIESGFFWEQIDGFTDFPHRATAKAGSAVLNAVVERAASAVVALAESGDSDSRRLGFQRWGAGNTRT